MDFVGSFVGLMYGSGLACTDLRQRIGAANSLAGIQIHVSGFRVCVGLGFGVPSPQEGQTFGTGLSACVVSADQA